MQLKSNYQFRFVIAQLVRGANTQLVQCWTNFLEMIRGKLVGFHLGMKYLSTIIPEECTGKFLFCLHTCL